MSVPSSATVVLHPVECARSAGLRYTTDARPGIRRVRSGKGFTYIGPDGRRIRNRAELDRIRCLVIPPAWTDVWICPDPRGHLQATGRDARGRKQYRYHPKWREVRDETKYERLIDFARALSKIRRTTTGHLRRSGLPREKVLATVVQLLEKTLIRIGNDEYARTNRSYGLTTLRDTHVEVSGQKLRFTFRGKSGVEHEVDLDDRRLARIVKQCRGLPGYELFQYIDEKGRRQSVTSDEVNTYLRQITGQEVTSKDFRTWAGTVLAAQLLKEFDVSHSGRHATRNIARVVELVAERLGNTKAVCRKSYIHPAVLTCYLDGSLRQIIETRARKVARAVERLTDAETAVLGLLQVSAGRDRKRKAS